MAQGASWHVSLSIPKNRTKNIQNWHFYGILKLTFLEIFKNKSFRFSKFSLNFFSDLCLGSSDRLTYS